MPQEPQYLLVDGVGDTIGAVYADSNDDLVLFHADSGNEVFLSSSGLNDGTDDFLTALGIEDSGVSVIDADNVNFGTDLSVTDDGDGSVTVDYTGSGGTDTRIDVSDDGTLVVSEPTDLNAGTNLSATDDGDGTVTLDADSGTTEAERFYSPFELSSVPNPKPPVPTSAERWTVGNPAILEATEPWETGGSGIIDPDIIWDETRGKVACVYSSLGSPGQMGVAFGDDMYDLTKSSANPVLESGGSGSWDEANAFDGQVFGWPGTEGNYALLYVGIDGSGNYGWGLAYSDDLENWTKDSNNPIVTESTLGTEAKDPSLVEVNGTWNIFYEYTATQKVGGRVTTTDFSTFNVDSSNPVIESSGSGIEDPQIQYVDGVWHLHYDNTTDNRDIWHATSTDPSSWGTDPGDEILECGARFDQLAHVTWFYSGVGWIGAVGGELNGDWRLWPVENDQLEWDLQKNGSDEQGVLNFKTA